MTDLRFAYNVEALEKTYKKLKETKSSHAYCIKNAECDRNQHIDVYPTPCSRYCPCICCLFYDRQDGLSFYGEELKRLMEEFDREKDVALNTPIGIAFITFKTHQMAKNIYDTFNDSPFPCYKPQLPKASEIDNPKAWKVRYAPSPDDIYWTELGSSRRFLMAKYIVVNAALFIFLLFLSTPGSYYWPYMLTFN